MESGALVAIGVVQEQHPDRIRLYRQWRELEWPVFVDALNVLDHRVVPIPMGLSESGQVVFPRMRRRDLPVFLEKDFRRVDLLKAPPPHAHAGDAFFHAGRLDDAVDAYRKSGDDPRALFRLGVALRRRFESDGRRPGDGQAAVDAWTRALEADPGQYVWRRRLQQYGPRLDKPYNMFGWVEQARREIRARGEEPVPLSVEPRGSELIGRGPVPTVQLVEADPKGEVPRDEDGLATIETIVTPPRVQPGQRVRVRLVFRVGSAYWNNEADPIAVHVKPPAGVTFAEGTFSYPVPERAETREPRILEFELAIGRDAEPGAHSVPGYALYNVCKDEGGVCLFLRRDFATTVTVDPKAPKIQ